MGVGMRVKEKGAFRSQVPKVLLQINPGVDRQLAAQIQLMNKLREKSNRSGDFKRHRFTIDYEARRDRTRRLYARLAKVDDDTRKAIDKINKNKNINVKGMQPTTQYVADRGRSSFQTRGAQPGSPTTAMGRTAWGESTSLDSYAGATATAGTMQGEWSRRSSLKSSIIQEMDGMMSRCDSPQHTDNPFGHDDSPRDREHGGHHTGAQSSRRSSIGSTLMPEVLVTRAVQSDNPDDNDAQRENPPQISSNIIQLLPNPTPTRFVGKMHAVLSTGSEKRRKKSDGFSRKSSVMTETIIEGDALETAQEDDNLEDAETAGEIIKTASNNNKKKSICDLAVSSRFIGRISKMRANGTDGGEEGDVDVGGIRKTSRSNDVSAASSRAGSPTQDFKKGGGWRKIGMSSDKNPVTSKTQAGTKGSRPESVANQKRGGRWNKLQRESSVRSASPTSNQIAEKFATAARVVNKLKSSSLKKTDDEILAAFGADDSEDETYEEADAAERKRDQTDQTVGGGPMEGQGKGFGLGALAGLASWGGRRAVEQEEVKQTSLAAALSLGMSTTSRFVGKMQNLQQKGKIVDLSNLDEITRSWMTGIPTSIRFLGKSVRMAPSGPGGIVVRDDSPPPGGIDIDFSHTVNMLTLLAKADIKLKAQSNKEHPSESRPNSPSAPQTLAAPSTTKKGRSRSGSRSRKGSLISSMEDSSISDPKKGANKLESGEVSKKLLESLMTVRHSSIARWNEHKDVKEDKERQPFLFKLNQKTEKISNQESVDFGKAVSFENK